MATGQAVSVPLARAAGGAQQAAGVTRQAGAANGGAPDAASQALVPVTRAIDDAEQSCYGGPVLRLPVELDVAVPVRDFRVRNLLALEAGQLIGSQWNHGDDLPIAAGDVQLAWSEFEVVETELAVRITRLA